MTTSLHAIQSIVIARNVGEVSAAKFLKEHGIVLQVRKGPNHQVYRDVKFAWVLADKTNTAELVPVTLVLPKLPIKVDDATIAAFALSSDADERAAGIALMRAAHAGLDVTDMAVYRVNHGDPPPVYELQKDSRNDFAVTRFVNGGFCHSLVTDGLRT